MSEGEAPPPERGGGADGEAEAGMGGKAPPPGRYVPRVPAAGGLSEADVTRILALVPPGTSAADRGLSVDDLARAAEEAGLDPAAVRRAAALTLRPPAPVSTLLMGAPARRQVMLPVAPGTRTPDVAPWAAAVERVVGRPGAVETGAGGEIRWREDHGLGRTEVVLEPSPQGSVVRAEADRFGHALASWFAAALLWGGGLALLPAGTVGLPAALASLVAAPFLLLRPWWRRADRRTVRRLQAAALEAARLVEEPPTEE